jgi:hypothetical protein
LCAEALKSLQKTYLLFVRGRGILGVDLRPPLPSFLRLPPILVKLHNPISGLFYLRMRIPGALTAGISAIADHAVAAIEIH